MEPLVLLIFFILFHLIFLLLNSPVEMANVLLEMEVCNGSL